MSFLRSDIHSSPDSSLSRQRLRRTQQQYVTDSDEDEHEREHAETDDLWGLGAMGSNPETNRIRWVNRQRDELNSVPNYESRLPDSRSIYGWAPGENDSALDILHEWVAGDPADHVSRHVRGDNLTGVGGVGEGGGGAATSESQTGAYSGSTESILQNIRRNPRLPRTRTLHNYLMERGRVWEAEERERLAASTSRAYRYLPTSRGEGRLFTHNDLRSRINAHRLYLDNQSLTDRPSQPYPRLKETIKYLERLRYSNTYEESLNSAAANGFVQLENFCCSEDDFILDTASIAPPTECSWLRPGMVFSGAQRTARNGDPLLSQLTQARNDPLIVNSSSGSNNETGRIQVQTSIGRRYVPQNLHHRIGGGGGGGVTNTSKDENWPVKVTIHSVNHDDMTISGTMEAYNIPDKTSPTPDAHVITFLEGEIIDFNKFTLETGKFRASTDTDSMYWRQLQPFKHLTDIEVVKNLVNKKWVTEELSKTWLLMRWKGMSFIFFFFFFFFFCLLLL